MAVSASTVTTPRLHLEDAAGDEDELLLAVAGHARCAPHPGLMRVISGAWRGRMPSSPFAPGSATTISPRPEKIVASALTTST
jgi:hypothetical protein